MAEMKTLNGYEIVDDKARKNLIELALQLQSQIDILQSQLDELKAKVIGELLKLAIGTVDTESLRVKNATITNDKIKF